MTDSNEARSQTKQRARRAATREGLRAALRLSLLAALSTLLLVGPTQEAFAEGAGRAVAAERLVLRLRDGRTELVSRNPITKTLAAALPLPPGPRRFRGSWFELRSPTGALRYRGPLQNPGVISYEAATAGGPEGSVLERFEASVPEQIFSVVVPRGKPGDVLLLFGVPHGAPAQFTAASELARIPLDPR